MSDKNYYLLELDDMVIALENKDAVIREFKETLKECKNYIETEQKMLVECSPYWEKQMNDLLSKINNAIGENNEKESIL